MNRGRTKMVTIYNRVTRSTPRIEWCSLLRWFTRRRWREISLVGLYGVCFDVVSLARPALISSHYLVPCLHSAANSILPCCQIRRARRHCMSTWISGQCIAIFIFNPIGTSMVTHCHWYRHWRSCCHFHHNDEFARMGRCIRRVRIFCHVLPLAPFRVTFELAQSRLGSHPRLHVTCCQPQATATITATNYFSIHDILRRFLPEHRIHI